MASILEERQESRPLKHNKMVLTKLERRKRIKLRIRKVVSGTPEMPRLTVFRSNKQIYAQVVDDVNGMTLAAASSVKNEKAGKGNKIDQAGAIGKELGEKAVKAGVTKVAFDRNGYLYHGRVRSLAEAARKAGLQF